MIKQVIERISNSVEIKEDFITCAVVKKGRPTKWYIRSSDNGNEYLVFMNDINDTLELQTMRKSIAEKEEFSYAKLHGTNPNLPHCDCPDWKRYQLPCKHIVALMRIYGFDWYAFPKSYQESPFFTIDEDVVGKLAENDCTRSSSH